MTLGFAQLALLQQRGSVELRTDKPIEQVLSYVTFGEPSKKAREVIETTRKLAEKMS